MPKGERFYYRHLEKVVDGTKCFNDGSLDVCVDGQCMVRNTITVAFKERSAQQNSLSFSLSLSLKKIAGWV